MYKLYELGLSYSAIGTHQSAIEEIPSVPKLGEHWLMFRFMKRIFHLRPQQPRYTKTWNVDKVLSYLEGLESNGLLSLKQMTLRIAVLLTILAGRGIQTLHMLTVIRMDQSHDKVIFHIIRLIKCLNHPQQTTQWFTGHMGNMS